MPFSICSIPEMAISPPASPHSVFDRSSAARHVQRSSSRMSVGTKSGGSSKASDEDTKTAVKVGEYKYSREPNIFRALDLWRNSL